jgi:hypothetical protein
LNFKEKNKKIIKLTGLGLLEQKAGKLEKVKS